MFSIYLRGVIMLRKYFVILGLSAIFFSANVAFAQEASQPAVASKPLQALQPAMTKTMTTKKQNLNQQITQLTTENDSLQTTVTGLQKNMQDLADQLNAQTKKNAQLQMINQVYQKQLQNVKEYLPASMPNMDQEVQYTKEVMSTTTSPNWVTLTTIIVLLVLFLLIVLGFDGCKKMKAKKIAKANEEKFQEISGEDINATKLDLARAYIDMHDISKARTLLQEVVKNGNDEHRKEASQLLAELK
jgi:FimV-like protein